MGIVREFEGEAILVVDGDEIGGVTFDLIVRQNHRGGLSADGRLYADLLAQDRATHGENVELRRGGKSLPIGVTNYQPGRAWAAIAVMRGDALNF